MSNFKSQNIVCNANFLSCFQSVLPLFWFAISINTALFESSNQKRLRDMPRFSVG